MSTLEITEKEFLIKLDRKQFNVAFVRSLLKMVEVASPTEEDFRPLNEGYDQVYRDNDMRGNYFGSLDEK